MISAIYAAGSLMGAFAALPSTTNYQLNSYGFGSGGTSNSSTSNYSLEGISGEVSSQPASTTTYTTEPGYTQTQQANVPTVTLSNPSNYYDKLKFVIDQQGNPSDALYALQISTTSNFSSDINYVKSDDTIGPTLTTADYQTYSAWGGGSGTNIIGLAANTTYYLRAKATQGQFTESAYGPASSAATAGQSISFCLYTSGSCAGGGNSVAFGGLLASSITSAPNNINTDFATNANFGGNVYVYSLNGGLKSSSVNYTIPSSTADLSSASQGYGAQITSASQTAGGPLNKVTPYNNSGNNVGALSTTYETIFTSSVPITGGSGSVQLKVKPSATTPIATDYADTITFVAAASF